MSRSTKVDVTSPVFVEAVASAVAAVLAAQQSTTTEVVEATTTTPGFAKAGKGLVWFVKTDGTKVKATPKQATAWDNVRKASQAKSAARTRARGSAQDRPAHPKGGTMCHHQSMDRVQVDRYHKVGAVVLSGYWGKQYTVLSHNDDGSITVRWHEDASVTTHRTPKTSRDTVLGYDSTVADA